MNARQILGLTSALVVVVPALALADAAEYQDEIESLVVVQQHSVFVEIFIFQEKNKTERHPFGAIVGLIKDCQIARQRFDNAVLWFNDQFLFGNKFVREVVQPKFPSLGENVPGKFYQVEEPGDTNPDLWRYTEEDCGDVGDSGVRHANFIPDLWVAARPVADPDVVNAVVGIDPLETLIGLDNDCFSCVFDYITSFFVVDPNGVRWLIDKYAYPLCLIDALGEIDDALGAGGLVESDPGDICGSRHANVADDYNPPVVNPGDEENHCLGPTDTASEDLCDINNPAVGSYSYTEDPGDGIIVTKEPLWISHIQVDVDFMGFRDEAPWKWTGLGGANTVRPGAPRYDAADDNTANDRSDKVTTDPDPLSPCLGGSVDPICSIEYNFLLVIDFAMVDNGLSLFENEQNRDASNSDTGKGSVLDAVDVIAGADPEYIETCKEHGEGGADNILDSYLVDGNSHPNNPTFGALPDVDGDGSNSGLIHEHECVVVDVLPLDTAPYFSEAHNVWDPIYRRPPQLNADCDDLDGAVMVEDPVTGEWTDGVAIWAATLDEDIAAREFEVCDVDDDAGEYFVADPFATVPPDDNLFP